MQETTANQPAHPVTVREYARQNYKTIAVAAVIVLLAAGWLYQVQVSNQLHKQTTTVSDRHKTVQNEATTLKNEVAKVVQLPSNETPTVATVTDVKKLQNQAFFSNAQNGDKVMMFAQAKQVILYRPTLHKVIQIAPINLGNGSSAPSIAQ